MSKSEPPLEDPLHVGEHYADEIAAFEVRNGLCFLTFATVRSAPKLKSDKAVTHRRVVTDRLILGPQAALELRQLLQAAIKPIEAPQTGTDKPN